MTQNIYNMSKDSHTTLTFWRLEKKEKIRNFLEYYFKFLKNNNIDPLLFHNMMGLPFFISQKTFEGFFSDKKNINIDSFIELIMKLLCGDFLEISKLIFSILDANKDKNIYYDNVRVFFSHFIISNLDEENGLEYEKIGLDIILSFFKNKNKLNYQEFNDIIIKENSDLVYLFYFLYAENFFIHVDSYHHYYSKFDRKDNNQSFYNDSSHKCFTFDSLLHPPSDLLFDYMYKKYNFIYDSDTDLDDLEKFEIDLKICKEELSNKKLSNSELHPKELVPQSLFGFSFLSPSDISHPMRSKTLKSFNESNYYDSTITYEYLNIPVYIVKKDYISPYNLDLVGTDIYVYNPNTYKLSMIIPISNLYCEKSSSEGDSNPTRGYHSLTLYSTFSNKVKKLELLFKHIQQIEIIILYIEKIKNETLCYNLRYMDMVMIDRGSFGEILKATDSVDGKEVAIKVINKNYNDQSIMTSVINEKCIALFLKKKKHQGIVTILDVFETKDQLIIVEEYVPNGNLQSFLYKNSISSYDKDEMIRQIGESINFLHSYGIVHRDLKLENILVDLTTTPIQTKIIDFGLSKIVAFNETMNEQCGTLLYLPPEIVQNEKYTQKIDIWDFGIIAFSIFNFGTHPFFFESEIEILLEKITSHQFNFEQIDPKYSNILSLCLQKESKRINSNELITLLKSIH